MTSCRAGTRAAMHGLCYFFFSLSSSASATAHMKGTVVSGVRYRQGDDRATSSCNDTAAGETCPPGGGGSSSGQKAWMDAGW